MDRLSISELLSCLQKSIRRNELDLALDCAIRIDYMKYNLWKKLYVFSSEDIGIACPWIASYVLEQEKQYNNELDNNKKRYILFNTINYLCQQYKTRLADDIAHAYFKLYIPPIDCKKKDIKKMVYMFNTALNEKNTDYVLRIAANLYDTRGERKMIEILKYKNIKEISALIAIYNKFKDTKKAKSRVLFLINAILHYTMNIDSIPTLTSINDLDKQKINMLTLKPRNFEMPDWIYDKHTKQGIEMGRDMRHFYDEGAKLVNSFVQNPYEKIARFNNGASDLTHRPSISD